LNVPLTSTAPFNPSTLALGFVGDQGLHHATAVTKEQFADLFAAYNASLWPAVLALWLASVAVSVMLLSRRRHDRWVLALLAADWIWSALAYHVAFFARINSAA
jgi:hypothetical protein